MTVHLPLLDRIERYYDLAPRASATVEAHGPLTLFVGRGGAQFYARPRAGADPSDITTDLVRTVLARQKKLGVPRALEWVDDLAPGLDRTVAVAGVPVTRVPLLALDSPAGPREVPGIELRVVGASDSALPATLAAISLAFRAGGTEVGDGGAAARDAAAAQMVVSRVDRAREAIEAGRSFMVVATAEDGPVGGGSAGPRGDVAELTGIGVLPGVRHRGIGLAVATTLAAEARRQGVDVVFMTAASDAVARIYGRAGFRRIATACIAELD